MARLFSTVAAIVMVSATLNAQSLSGDWELSIIAPDGPITATATLKQDGEKLTGTFTSPQGTMELAGTYKGKTVNLAFQVQTPNGNMDIKVNGEVDGNNIKGVIDFGMGMVDFTGKKK